MAERIPSDHPSVETIRARVDSAGATDRPRISIPDEHRNGFPADETVGLVLDGRECHARVTTALDGGIELRGAYDNARLARTASEGKNRLIEWIRNEGLEIGRSVLVDVVVRGETYGVRRPGVHAVYRITEEPDESLATIAERAERDRES